MQLWAWLVIGLDLTDGNVVYCCNPGAFNIVPTPKIWPKRNICGTVLSWSETCGVSLRWSRGITHFYVHRQWPPGQNSVLVLTPRSLSTLKLLLRAAPKEQKYTMAQLLSKSNLAFGAEWHCYQLSYGEKPESNRVFILLSKNYPTVKA